MTNLVLVANPGSSSRKYALYDQDLNEKASLHFESEDGHLICNLHGKDGSQSVKISLQSIDQAGEVVESIFRDHKILKPEDKIEIVGLRIVAPRTYFMKNHIINDEVIDELQSALESAPLHIAGTLNEIKLLKKSFKDSRIVGVSDSAFHITKPSYAWNYGINLEDADKFDIKRFGYHGLSVAATVRKLTTMDRLAPKIIVCHLGSGSSVTAVYNGKSFDNTMGFTPLEGVVMATRSGSVDAGALRALSLAKKFNSGQLEDYLNHESGLLGLSGSNDIRELIDRENNGDHIAHLALSTMVHSFHKAIGQMMAVLGGADMIVFTGTVGERSAILRRRLVAHLNFADFTIDTDINEDTIGPDYPVNIASLTRSKPIFVIPTNEGLEIAAGALKTVQEAQNEN